MRKGFKYFLIGIVKFPTSLLKMDEKVTVNPKESVQIINVSKNFGKIICPSRMLIAGPTTSEKSWFMAKMIEHRSSIYNCIFDRIIYFSPHCLSGSQNNYIASLRTFFPNLEISANLPNPDDLNIVADDSHKLFLIDDFMESFNNSSLAFRLLTIDSHHRKITVIVTTHNLFDASKYKKTFSRNYSEMVILANRGDKLSLRTLGSQMFPDSPRILLRAMAWVEEHSEEKPKYILLDVSPITTLPANMIVRTNIFPKGGIEAPIFFIPEAEN